ncbi:MAG: HD-GYP domain-containing protein, partial [Alphaproteobacteria bacterium]
EQASSLRDAIPVVLHHHERFNGGGYPHGLRGTEIPLGARIVAVADAYHAMVHDRPYKDAQTHEEALDERLEPSGHLGVVLLDGGGCAGVGLVRGDGQRVHVWSLRLCVHHLVWRARQYFITL